MAPFVLIACALVILLAIIAIGGSNRRVEPFEVVASDFDPCETLPTQCDCETYEDCQWLGSSQGCKKRKPNPPRSQKFVIDRPMYAKKTVNCSDLNISMGQCMATNGICKWKPKAATASGTPLIAGGICESS